MEVEITIDALAYGGDAVGRLPDGRVCFVPGLLPGERAEIAIVQEKRTFARGKVMRLISVSPERIPVCCPLAAGENRCPGCAYQHCTYDLELEWKQRQLASFLVRGGLIAPERLLPPFASPARFGTRNKIKLTGSGDGFGYLGTDNETVIPVSSCALAAEPINRELAKLVRTNQPEVTLRYTARNGVRRFYGKPGCRVNWLTEDLPGIGDFKVPAGGFFQTNIGVCCELVRRAAEEIARSGAKRLVELYCGVGIFSIAAALKVGDLQCTGIEIAADSVAAASFNAGRHQVGKRCRFLAGDAGKLLKKQTLNDALLLIDPPRSGMAPAVLDEIIAQQPGEIIYVSCAADTLARDLKKLTAAGWSVDSAGLLDMFPATAHFEVMTILKRGNPDI